MLQKNNTDVSFRRTQQILVFGSLKVEYNSFNHASDASQQYLITLWYFCLYLPPAISGIELEIAINRDIT